MTVAPCFFPYNLEICREHTYHNFEVTFRKYFYIKTSLASRVMPKQSQNEINKYCSCYSEYIYKCQDFCDGSGNEL